MQKKMRRGVYGRGDLSEGGLPERKPPRQPRPQRRHRIFSGTVAMFVVLLLYWSSPDGWLTTSHMSFRQKAGDAYWMVRSAYSRSTVPQELPKKLRLNVTAAREECVPQETSLAMHLKVPKAASTTIFDLLYALAAENHFALDSRPLYVAKGNEERSRREYVAYLSSFQVRTARTAHCPYINVGKRPAYFGLVRDPIKRLQSHYEYIHWGPRSPWATFWKGQDTTAPTFVHCVAQKMHHLSFQDKDCLAWANAQLVYFCGIFCVSPQAITANKTLGYRAYLTATANVHRDFVAVGVVERYHDALVVFEHVLPSFFRNANHIAAKLGVSRHNTMKKTPATSADDVMSNDTFAFLRNVMTWEYRFYDDVVRDFDHQLIACQNRYHHHHHRKV